MIDYILLLTDFGLKDPYISQIKMILYKNTDCTIIDISHDVSPYNIVQAAFFLKACWNYIPDNSVCIAVVDPGVGTERNILVMQDGTKYVIAPDNGVISWILNKDSKLWYVNMEFFQGVSYTFHGRDIFVPVAIRIYNDKVYEVLKEISKDEIVRLQDPVPELADNRLKATVISIDKFGNCVLNIPSFWKEKIWNKKLYLNQPKKLRIYPSSTYSQIPCDRIGLVDGSQGFLELASYVSSCKDILGLNIGDKCVIVLES